MKEIYTQKVKNIFVKVGMVPVSREDIERLESFEDNQILKNKTSGAKKPRSVNQNKWIHAMFRYVAKNTDHPDWNTEVKVKSRVKLAMKFFEDGAIVVGVEVYFKFRSFAFDKMGHVEANKVYNEAKNVCADFLGVDPKLLEAEAKRESVE